MKEIPVALQSYTVRDKLSKDYKGTLEKIAQMGYSAIEIGGFGPYTTDEWNKILSRLNLKILANHIQIEMLEESFNHIAEFNHAIGNKRIVCPYLREERRQDADGYKRTAETLNSIGSKCKEKGFEFYYHNHAFEFQKFDGRTGFDILFEDTDPGLVRFELDTCWVKYGGEDPAEFIKKFAGRCQVIHLKDLAAGSKLVFKEVGEGIIDFESVFKAASDVDVEWFVVEQDICERPSLESIKTSYENIKKIKTIV